GVKISFIHTEYFRPFFRMNDLAHSYCRIRIFRVQEPVLEFFRRRVDLLLDNSQDILQRMTAGKTEIRLIRHSAEKCRHKYSSASDKGPDFLRPAAFVHIIERGGHKPVSA